MKKFKIFILLLVSALGLYGCGSKQDINELIFISAIGFDKSEKDGFKMIAQIVNNNVLVPDPPQITPVLIVTSEGETVLDCLVNLNNLLPNRPYMINLQMVVFSEEVAKEGINEYMHFFVNFSESQHEYNVVITKDISAEDLMSQISVFSMFPTRVLINKLKTATDYYGFARMTFVEEVVNTLRSDYGTLVLSSITAKGDLEKGKSIDQTKETDVVSKIEISDIGVFKDGKLKGWLSKDESVAYNFIHNKIERAYMTVDGTKGNKISNLLRMNKSKITVEVKNNQPSVYIDIKFNVLVTEDTSLVIEIEKEYEEHVERMIKEKLTKQIEDLIVKGKSYFEFDIFGFSEYFYKYEPKWYEANKLFYDEIFKTMPIYVNVIPNIERMDV